MDNGETGHRSTLSSHHRGGGVPPSVPACQPSRGGGVPPVREVKLLRNHVPAVQPTPQDSPGFRGRGEDWLTSPCCYSEPGTSNPIPDPLAAAPAVKTSAPHQSRAQNVTSCITEGARSYRWKTSGESPGRTPGGPVLAVRLTLRRLPQRRLWPKERHRHRSQMQTKLLLRR